MDWFEKPLSVVDPDEHARTETALRADPAVRTRLDRLRANLAPLSLARSDESPPAGLADRTLAFVFDRPIPSTRTAAAGARRAIGGDREPVFAPSRWRRVDAVVAACIVVMIGGLGVSGVGRLQKQHRMTVPTHTRRLARTVRCHSQSARATLSSI